MLDVGIFAGMPIFLNSVSLITPKFCVKSTTSPLTEVDLSDYS